MIQEDYCSFEVAKLLKEKGFDYKGFDYIDFEGEVIRQDRPTHQMAMKWLREIHKLHITILWDCGACIGKNSFCYHIDRIDNYEDKGYNKIGFDSNEEAVEAALKYSLENLI